MCVVGDNSKILSQVCFFSFWKSQYTSDRLSSSKSHQSYLNVYLKVPNYPAIADKMAYQYLRQLTFAACRFLLRQLSLKDGLHSCRPYLRENRFLQETREVWTPAPDRAFHLFPRRFLLWRESTFLQNRQGQNTADLIRVPFLIVPPWGVNRIRLNNAWTPLHRNSCNLLPTLG